MKRFVTYIYSYEDKKKGSNAGFARIEIRGGECRVEIHLRGSYGGKDSCEAYLFREEAGAIVGFPICGINIQNGKGDSTAKVKEMQIGESPFGISQMDGLIILGKDGRIFLSCWKDGLSLEVDREKFRVWEPAEPTEEGAGKDGISNRVPAEPAGENWEKDGMSNRVPAEPADENQELSMPGKETGMDAGAKLSGMAGAPQTSGQSDGKRSGKLKKDQESAEASTETSIPAELPEEGGNVSATEIPMRNIFPEYDWESAWDGMAKEHPTFTPFADRNTVCIQIELRELRELPKRYWYLGNNSFLLHGFFNYRYLVVGKTGEGHWFIGIPGIYQRQERVMAAIFGFPEFMAAATQGNQHGEKGAGGEDGPMNQFGCWCRFMDE